MLLNIQLFLIRIGCSWTEIASVRPTKRFQLGLWNRPRGSLARLRCADGAVTDQPQHRHGADAEPLGGLLQRQFAALGHLAGAMDLDTVADSIAANPCLRPGVAAWSTTIKSFG